jgi:hypothetical protein
MDSILQTFCYSYGLYFFNVYIWQGKNWKAWESPHLKKLLVGKSLGKTDIDNFYGPSVCFQYSMFSSSIFTILIMGESRFEIFCYDSINF